MSASEKHFFHAAQPKYFLGGRAGKERRGEDLQIGPRNGAANQRKLAAFHLTHNTLAQQIGRSRGQGCTPACQIFRFKAKTSERCSSPPGGGSCTFALITPPPKKKKCRGFSSACSPSCSDCRKIPTWQNTIKLSSPCVFFVYVFGRNGARSKTW